MGAANSSFIGLFVFAGHEGAGPPPPPHCLGTIQLDEEAIALQTDHGDPCFYWFLFTVLFHQNNSDGFLADSREFGIN